MLTFHTFAVYCVGIYCFSRIYWNLIDSDVERERLEKRLRAAQMRHMQAEEEAKEKEREKEEEEEVRRIVRSRRSEKKRG